MNDLILGYARITCYAALYSMMILIGYCLRGESYETAKDYRGRLMDTVQELDKESDKLLTH